MRGRVQGFLETADPEGGHARGVDGHIRGKAFQQEVEAAAPQGAGTSGSHQHRHFAAACEQGQVPGVDRHSQAFHHAPRSFDAPRNAIPPIHGGRCADHEEKIEADLPEIGDRLRNGRIAVLAASDRRERPAERFHARPGGRRGLLKMGVLRAFDPGLEKTDPQGAEGSDRDRGREARREQVDFIPGKGERQDFQRRQNATLLHPGRRREGSKRHALAGRVQFVHPALVDCGESRLQGIHLDQPVDG